MLAGLVFSVLTAVSMSLGNLFEKRAVDAMSTLSARRARQMLMSLLRSRLWLAGFVISLVGLAFQVEAFALAPLAVVQSIYGAGLVALVVVARIVFREPLGRREVVGLGVIVVAVVLVGISLGAGEGAIGLSGSAGRVVLVACLTTFISLAGLLGARRLASFDPGIAFGVASGLFYGVGSLGTKGASTLVARYGVIGSLPHLFASAYPYLFVVASLLGLLVFQTGLQRSRVALVAPLSNVVSSAYVVAAGMALFAEPLPAKVGLTALRLAGFAGVLVGTGLLAAGTSPRALRSGPPAPEPLPTGCFEEVVSEAERS
jgi:multidrug transporter EmrE-like cation transporter